MAQRSAAPPGNKTPSLSSGAAVLYSATKGSGNVSLLFFGSFSRRRCAEITGRQCDIGT